MWIGVERFPVQILGVVAMIQVRFLKTEVEKGSIWTEIGYGWVDPKDLGYSWKIVRFLFR